MTPTAESCIYHHHSIESVYPNNDTQAIELRWNAKMEGTRALFQLQRQIHLRSQVPMTSTTSSWVPKQQSNQRIWGGEWKVADERYYERSSRTRNLNTCTSKLSTSMNHVSSSHHRISTHDSVNWQWIHSQFSKQESIQIASTFSVANEIVCCLCSKWRTTTLPGSL